MKTEGLDDAFLTCASAVLADTDKGLSGNKIVKLCSEYALRYNRVIPQTDYPFNPRTLNKRTALKQNLSSFTKAEQFQIIKELCELEDFDHNEEAQNIKIFKPSDNCLEFLISLS